MNFDDESFILGLVCGGGSGGGNGFLLFVIATATVLIALGLEYGP